MTTIIFSTVIGVASLIVFLFSTLYISDGVLKRKEIHKKIIDIVLIGTLLILILLHILFFFKFNIGEENIEPKLIVMLLSFVLASLTIIITVNNNKRTSENNLDVHHTNLLMKMIENNYKLIYDENLKLHFQEILELLKKEFSIEQKKYQYLVKRIIEEGESCVDTQYIENFKRTISANPDLSKNEKRKIIGLVDWKRDSIERVVLSCMYKNQFHGYKSLDMDKAFSKESYEIINSAAPEIITFISKNIQKHNTNFKEDIIKSEYHLDEIKKSISSIYNKYYPQLGHFFRHTHRIIKLINKYYPDNKTKRNEFLGILRAYYSEDLLLVLYYNSTFTYKGSGLGVQLMYSDFFGNVSDFEKDDLMHFRKDLLIFEDIDIQILKEVYSSFEVEEFKYINQNELSEIDKFEQIILNILKTLKNSNEK